MAPAPSTLHPYSSSILSSLLLLVLATSSSTVVFADNDLRLDGGAEYGWDTNQWRSQVDGVMGGQSTGSLTFEQSNAIMSFSGNINIDGGGFSSVRKERFEVMDLTSYAGIVVQLETTEVYDGGSIQPPLGLHLQFHDVASRTYGYASAFAVPLASAVGEETSVYLPLTSFDRGSRMGFTCNGCEIDFSAVNEMDIYVLYQEGPFDVRIKAITAVDTPKTFSSPVISIASKDEIKGLIDSTISSGGSLYDYGYGELCIAVYRSTLNTLLAADADSVVTNVIKGMICQGLQRAETQSDSKTSTAWTLRYTMDGILEELGFSDPDGATGWRPDATTAESLADRCSGVTSGIKAASLPTDAAYPNAPTPGSESPPTDTTIDDNNTSKMIASSTSSSSSLRNAGVVAAVTTTVLLYVMM